MGITVKEALGLPPLSESNLLTGKNGLCNLIESVTVIDAPDAAKWLKGNELVLTTAYAYNSKADIEKIIKDLAHVKVAAFGIKLGRFIQEVPKEILELAESLKLPVFNIPFNCSYIDIINPVLSNLFTKKALILEYSEQIYMHMTKIILKGGDLKDLLHNLVEQVNSSAVIVSLNNEILEFVNCQSIEIDKEQMSNLISSLNSLKQYSTKKVSLSVDLSLEELNKIIIQEEFNFEGNNYKMLIMPITNEDELFGFLIEVKKNSNTNELEIIAMKYTSLAAALLILKNKSVINVQKKYKNDFISDLISGRFETELSMIIRGKYWGWDLSRKFVPIIINIDELQEYYFRCNKNESMVISLKERLLAEVEGRLKQFSPIISDISDTILVLMPVENNIIDSKKVKDRMIELCKELKYKLGKVIQEVSLTIGISSYCENLVDLKSKYVEANEAVKIGRYYSGCNNIYHYEELRVFNLLSNIKNKKLLNEFLFETIDIIVDYDRNNNTRLLNILNQYFLNNCCIKDTANAVYMHENTIRYKLRKIEELTEIDFNDVDSLLKMYIAYKIYVLKTLDN